MSWINHAFNAASASASNGPDTVEDHKPKLPGTFPSSPVSSPTNTKSKRSLSPAGPSLQPSPKRQRTEKSNVPESVLSDDEEANCFYDAPEFQPQPAPTQVGIERQPKRGFAAGGDQNDQQPASEGGSSGPPQPQQNDPDDNAASVGGSSGPRVYHNGPEALRMGGVFAPPPRPIQWPMAPKDMKIEDMPGFRGIIVRDGRRFPDFDEDTWELGFSRRIRKHISIRVKNEL